MHKITKGLKKKKKGKKSKHKEDELFKPEELEAYRREHQQQAAAAEESAAPTAPATGNDEWKKFNALTAGIDSFLKKTQDDLDRIKSTSFFQRVPPPSEVKKEEEEAEALAEVQDKQQEQPTLEPGIVEVSESESEEEDQDDIFDTSYIDALAAQDVKLAYIPESPIDEQPGDDPFDTSIAERAILGPAVGRKGKKLVPLGAAVEVLTGRVQAPTCVPIKRPSTRRKVLKEQDLLLGSFDENIPLPDAVKSESLLEHKPNILDDDTLLPHSDEPIDLSRPLHQINPTPEKAVSAQEDPKKNILDEFDVIAKKGPALEDEDDKEFALLAAESLSKAPAVAILPVSADSKPAEDSWQAFGGEKKAALSGDAFEEDNDPFDTTFAENVVPGKCELKIIENAILSNDDIDFNPRGEATLKELIKNQVSIQVTNPAGQRDTLERISEAELNVIQPQHRDLLGGSITDLTNLGDQPLKPKEKIDEDYIEYCDPFDTTIVDAATVPGQAELKFLEKELLSDIKSSEPLSDDDFDPRAEEYFTRKTSNASLKTVNFVLPISETGGFLEDGKKVAKPLTPYYVRENSLPEQPIEEEDIEDADPFDTSFAADIKPGKAELKVIESELFQPESELKRSLSDPDFNPRDEKQVAAAKVVQTIKEISQTEKPATLPVKKPEQIDLLAVDNEVNTKVLTPAAEKPAEFEELFYADPFDTSIASNILPGKAELKLLESELIQSANLKRVLTDPDFDPRDAKDQIKEKPQQKSKENVPDLLERTTDTVTAKPLTPVVGAKVSFDIGNDEDDEIDPFDTSIANNIGPGQVELKLLESELI